MSVLDVSLLNQRLLEEVTNYQPVYGQAVPVSENIKKAFKKYPRHHFIERFRLVNEMWQSNSRSSEEPSDLALIYTNQPLMYVGEKGQSLQASSSEPAFIIHLLALLDVQAGNKVLEIGCGTGWLLAMMAALSGVPENITGVEIVAELAEKARKNLRNAGLAGVNVIVGDGNNLADTQTQYDCIMYTASSYEFPEYLFALTRPYGRVVIPLRNKGLAEEVHVLERTEWGFRSLHTRLCKFVQMTQAHDDDPSGITPCDMALLRQIQHARKCSMAIPGGPPGTLAFSSFMSKTRPNYFMVGLSDPKVQPGFMAGVFGDPSAIGQCLLSKTGTSGAVWNNGTLYGFGDEKYQHDMQKGLTEWIAWQHPCGAQFGLSIIKSGQTYPVSQKKRVWAETRGNSDFLWSLTPSIECGE